MKEKERKPDNCCMFCDDAVGQKELATHIAASHIQQVLVQTLPHDYITKIVCFSTVLSLLKLCNSEMGLGKIRVNLPTYDK